MRSSQLGEQIARTLERDRISRVAVVAMSQADLLQQCGLIRGVVSELGGSLKVAAGLPRRRKGACPLARSREKSGAPSIGARSRR